MKQNVSTLLPRLWLKLRTCCANSFPPSSTNEDEHEDKLLEKCWWAFFCVVLSLTIIGALMKNFSTFYLKLLFVYVFVQKCEWNFQTLNPNVCAAPVLIHFWKIWNKKWSKWKKLLESIFVLLTLWCSLLRHSIIFSRFVTIYSKSRFSFRWFWQSRWRSRYALGWTVGR